MTYHTDYMTAGEPDCPHETWVTHPTHEVSTCGACGAVKEVVMTARVDVMARLLLELEWQQDADAFFFCPSCRGERDDEYRSAWLRVNDALPLADRRPSGHVGHAAACELVEVLRAARVLP